MRKVELGIDKALIRRDARNLSIVVGAVVGYICYKTMTDMADKILDDSIAQGQI